MESKSTYTELDLLRAAFTMLGDGQGAEWGDPENNEYTRGITELLGEVLGIDEFVTERRNEVLRRIRVLIDQNRQNGLSNKE